jgi:hypothetical protein
VSFYANLSAEQVAATYNLMKFLRRLRVIGRLEAHTEPAEDFEAFGHEACFNFSPAIYSIVKDGYSHDRGHMDSEELLERMFGRIQVPQLRGTS